MTSQRAGQCTERITDEQHTRAIGQRTFTKMSEHVLVGSIPGTQGLAWTRRDSLQLDAARRTLEDLH
ncbi:MAG: hypothetical protein R8J94_02710 [Acidimicrobiia bacterium]|nr:hypothetical protein [Acidimicrobiia bacterium]